MIHFDNITLRNACVCSTIQPLHRTPHFACRYSRQKTHTPPLNNNPHTVADKISNLYSRHFGVVDFLLHTRIRRLKSNFHTRRVNTYRAASKHAVRNSEWTISRSLSSTKRSTSLRLLYTSKIDKFRHCAYCIINYTQAKGAVRKRSE